MRAFVATLTLLATASLCKSDCTSNTPLAVSVTDIRISNGFSMRGIAASVGTPPQNISFMPAAFGNDSWLFNTTSDGYCGLFTSNAPPAECFTLRGGLFNVSGSSTSKAELNVYSTNADQHDDFGSDDSLLWNDGWVLDSLALNDTSLMQYPMGMADTHYGQQQYMSQAVLGMNSNSTLLTALLAAGRIASRSFAWWWGLNGGNPASQMDGQIVFGGYDTAKATGENYTGRLAPQTPDCPGGMYVDIADISLGFPNGKTSTLTGSSTLSACLELGWPAIVSFNSDPFYSNFEQLTGTQNIGRQSNPGLTYGAVLFAPDNVYDGGLIITLSSGLAFTVPNDILVVSPEVVMSDGSVQTNSSVRELLINPYDTFMTGYTPVLGKQFFSQAYLMVDYDAGSFTLWNANPTTDTALTSLAQKCFASANGTTSNATDSGPSHTMTPATGTQTASDHAFSLSSGAIAGIAVGSAAGAAALVAAVILLVLRRRQRYSTVLIDNKAFPGHESPTSYGIKAELDADQLLQEMAASERHPNELAADSRPSELCNDGMRYEKPADDFEPVEIG